MLRYSTGRRKEPASDQGRTNGLMLPVRRRELKLEWWVAR